MSTNKIFFLQNLASSSMAMLCIVTKQFVNWLMSSGSWSRRSRHVFSTLRHKKIVCINKIGPSKAFLSWIPPWPPNWISIQAQSPSKNLYSPRFIFVLKVYEVPVPFDIGLTLCLVVAPLATVESVTDLTAQGFPRPHFCHCHVVLRFEGL